MRCRWRVSQVGAGCFAIGESFAFCDAASVLFTWRPRVRHSLASGNGGNHPPARSPKRDH
jgi:hypothetical protein